MFISTQIGLNVYIFFLFFYRFNEAGFVCRYIRLHQATHLGSSADEARCVFLIKPEGGY